MTRGEDWVGSALELQYSGADFGTIKRSQGNTDFDFTFGGIKAYAFQTTSMMFGIAALNSSGSGVGITVYNDGNIYFAAISSYNYGSFSDSWGNAGWNLALGGHRGVWLRLKRISGTWTGYVSFSGKEWDKTFNTRADSITVSDIHFGLLYNNSTGYNGRLVADYFQQDT
jgi:hypothetical protein